MAALFDNTSSSLHAFAVFCSVFLRRFVQLREKIYSEGAWECLFSIKKKKTEYEKEGDGKRGQPSKDPKSEMMIFDHVCNKSLRPFFLFRANETENFRLSARDKKNLNFQSRISIMSFSAFLASKRSFISIQFVPKFFFCSCFLHSLSFCCVALLSVFFFNENHDASHWIQ